jgi:pimeloyl-ACP methyl ester carboxylesterase
MSFAQCNGIKLHYWRVGSGPDIVFLHGLIGNLALWHLKIVPLLQRSFRLTTYDLRGHGRSEMTPGGYTTLNMSADLAGLLDALDMPRVSLVGHSFGADIALHFALLHPQRVERMVLIDAGIAALLPERTKSDWVGWDYWVGKLREGGIEVPEDKRSDPHYLLNLGVETPKYYGPARSIPRKREPLLRLLNTTSIVKDYEDVGGMTLERIREIQTAALVLYGNKSHFMGTYNFLREALPNATARLIPGEHYLPLEQPELLASEIHGFLAQPEAAPLVPSKGADL